ncbi:hypothetical protein EMIHUDRAFT_445591, partial [Emiliania huxleyi CCMP1516]
AAAAGAREEGDAAQEGARQGDAQEDHRKAEARQGAGLGAGGAEEGGRAEEGGEEGVRARGEAGAEAGREGAAQARRRRDFWWQVDQGDAPNGRQAADRSGRDAVGGGGGGSSGRLSRGGRAEPLFSSAWEEPGSARARSAPRGDLAAVSGGRCGVCGCRTSVVLPCPAPRRVRARRNCSHKLAAARRGLVPGA